MDWIASLGSLHPIGDCLGWRPSLMWSLLAADAAIAAAYFSVPIAMLSIARTHDLALSSVAARVVLAFVVASGATHFLEGWSMWSSDFAPLVLFKIATAGLAMASAMALWPLLPKLLRVPTVDQVSAEIRSREAEVDKRHRVEDCLVESQQNFAVLLAGVDAGFIATDRHGNVTLLNAVAERLLGWTLGEVQGRDLWTVLVREGHPRGIGWINPVDALVGQLATIDQAQELMAISRTGKRTPLEMRAAITHASDGSVLGCAIVLRDLSPLWRAEAESSRLAAIVESSNDAIIGKTLDGRITSWNAAAEALFGYSADEAIGQSVRMLIPPDRDIEEMSILERLRQGTRVPAFETVRQTRDGRLLDVSISISPVRDAKGNIVGAAKIARDVSAARLAEAVRLEAQRLEAENRQMHESNRVKTLFMANMSHELRTPLNAIIGFSELLHSGAVPPVSSKHHEFVGHIRDSGKHLLRLVNDVLDLSKIEEGKFLFHPEPVELTALVSGVVGTLHTQIERKLTKVVTEIEPMGELFVDPARLRQVLYNYLSNAIKFTRTGGLVTVRAMAEGDSKVRIEVEDTGIGIAAADLPRLFVEFQQLDSGATKLHEGTGLGLALNRRLVEAQGGSVGVRSTVGAGSVFHLVLPRHPQPPAADRPLTQTIPTTPETLIRAFIEAGFKADNASPRQTALLNALERAYDSITLDVAMPDPHGPGVLARIQRKGAPPLATHAALQSGSVASHGFAVTDILPKPIDGEQIVRALQRAWPQAQAHPKVMVIDDDPLALEVMSETLLAQGIESICVRDGRQALRELEQHRPDAIVLDLMMPGFDGFAVLDALRLLPGSKDTPVFIWTSMVLTDEEHSRLARSARAILNKGQGPLVELLDTLRRWRQPAATTLTSPA